MPIQDSVEMGTNLAQLREELASTDFYPKLFESAFGTTEITDERIADALSQFVRSMVSYQSKYDQAIAAGTPQNPDFAATFTSQELLGEQIFHGSGECSTCHTTHAQIADRTHNIGLDADNSADEGAGQGRFKVMSLRNVSERGRFMHDGRFASLEEVVEFYSTGIQDNPNLAPGLRENGQPQRFDFSETEIEALVAFLGTLSDETFLTSELFSDPFTTLPGDFDGNGVVEAQDYEVWRQARGQTAVSWADGNGDGRVDLIDYTLWRDNLGATWETVFAGVAAGRSSALPEPTSFALAGVMLALHFCCRSRTRD